MASSQTVSPPEARAAVNPLRFVLSYLATLLSYFLAFVSFLVAIPWAGLRGVSDWLEGKGGKTASGAAPMYAVLGFPFRVGALATTIPFWPLWNAGAPYRQVRLGPSGLGRSVAMILSLACWPVFVKPPWFENFMRAFTDTLRTGRDHAIDGSGPIGP